MDSIFVDNCDECEIHGTEGFVSASIFYDPSKKRFIAFCEDLKTSEVKVWESQCEDDFDPQNPTDEQRWDIIDYVLGSTTDKELEGYWLYDAWMANMFMDMKELT
jgi:hypothetical protein